MYQYKTYDVFCHSMSVCLNIGKFNTVYFTVYSIVPCEQQLPNPIHFISVQCYLVATSIVSPFHHALPLQCRHMGNCSRQLRFWLSFGNQKKIASNIFFTMNPLHRKHETILKEEKLADGLFSLYLAEVTWRHDWRHFIALSHRNPACAFRCCYKCSQWPIYVSTGSD